jgi:hypothetical protein
MPPAHPPTNPNTPAQQRPKSDSLQEYHAFTDSVTGLSLRWKDYIFQAIVIAVCVGIGLLVGYLNRSTKPNADNSMVLLGGTLVGLIVGVLISGGVLMVLGWFRTAKHLREKKAQREAQKEGQQ